MGLKAWKIMVGTTRLQPGGFLGGSWELVSGGMRSLQSCETGVGGDGDTEQLHRLLSHGCFSLWICMCARTCRHVCYRH